MGKVKLCGICGKEFEKKARNQKYCCMKCKEKAAEIARLKGREKAKTEREKRKIKKVTIAEIDKLAKAAGMSYGKYISMLEQRDRSYTQKEGK